MEEHARTHKHTLKHVKFKCIPRTNDFEKEKNSI